MTEPTDRLRTPGQGTAHRPVRIAFFGHDSNEPAVRRRARAFCRAGCEVVGFMPRRGEARPTPFELHPLGETRDGAYGARLGAIRSGARAAAQGEAGRRLAGADVIYARNLDMLACAQLARRRAGLDTPVVYECLDVHRLLTGGGPAAMILRRLEGALLARTALLALSSPAFAREYFARVHPAFDRIHLLENRLVEADAPLRPALNAASRPPRPAGAPLRLGWFGNLRCRRTMDLMQAMADRFGARLRIELRGYPARTVFPAFEAEVSGRPNLRYGGRYEAPRELAELYRSVDLVWAGDWHEAGANSTWLLPNRIYEGGWFGVPAIAPAGGETARWLETRDAGWSVAAPEEESLAALLEALIAQPARIEAKRRAVLALPRETFIETPEDTRRLIAAALDVGAARPELARNQSQAAVEAGDAVA